MRNSSVGLLLSNAANRWRFFGTMFPWSRLWWLIIILFCKSGRSRWVHKMLNLNQRDVLQKFDFFDHLVVLKRNAFAIVSLSTFMVKCMRSLLDTFARPLHLRICYLLKPLMVRLAYGYLVWLPTIRPCTQVPRILEQCVIVNFLKN